MLSGISPENHGLIVIGFMLFGVLIAVLAAVIPLEIKYWKKKKEVQKIYEAWKKEIAEWDGTTPPPGPPCRML